MQQGIDSFGMREVSCAVAIAREKGHRRSCQRSEPHQRPLDPDSRANCISLWDWQDSNLRFSKGMIRPFFSTRTVNHSAWVSGTYIRPC